MSFCGLIKVRLKYHLSLHLCGEAHVRSGSYLWHIVDQQQRYGDGGDVVGAADLQDVSQAHDGRISRRDVPRAYVIIHAQVEDDVDLRQVRVPRDVKLTFRDKKEKKNAAGWAHGDVRHRVIRYRYLARYWTGFVPPLCSYHHLRSLKSLQGNERLTQ